MRIHVFTTLCIGALVIAPSRRGPTYERLFALKPKEGVFAYARIAPDGKRLAYASAINARPSAQRGWTVTVVDLQTQKVLFSDLGIDAYWSNDGTRLIYSGGTGVTVRNIDANSANSYPQASTSVTTTVGPCVMGRISS